MLGSRGGSFMGRQVCHYLIFRPLLRVTARGVAFSSIVDHSFSAIMRHACRMAGGRRSGCAQPKCAGIKESASTAGARFDQTIGIGAARGATGNAPSNNRRDKGAARCANALRQ